MTTAPNRTVCLLVSSALIAAAACRPAADAGGGADTTGAAAPGPDQQVAATRKPAREEEVYRSTCGACHQADGKGMPGALPPLAGDPVVNADDPAPHIAVVLNGMQGKPVGGVQYAAMPGTAAQLSDSEVALAVNYERTNWGNHGRLVTPAVVARVRHP